MNRISLKKVLVLSLTIAFWCVSAGPAMAETPAELAARVQARNKSINTLDADYTRISRFVAMGEQSGRQVKAAGRLFWRRPQLLRLEQDAPRKQLVIADLKTVWWVRADRKRADLYPIEQFTTGLKSLMDAIGGLASLEETFTVAAASPDETKAAEGAPVLALIPKVKRADLARLVVWFEPETLVVKGFRMVSLVGDVTGYRLRQVKVNQPVPDGAFKYTPPAGFRVTDHRRAAGER